MFCFAILFVFDLQVVVKHMKGKGKEPPKKRTKHHGNESQIAISEAEDSPLEEVAEMERPAKAKARRHVCLCIQLFAHISLFHTKIARVTKNVPKEKKQFTVQYNMEER